MVLYSGSCHCGRVKWTVEGPEKLRAIRCEYLTIEIISKTPISCSICVKKQNLHYEKSRRITFPGHDDLTTYRFNTGKAQHPFCKHCGVQSFYRPRSNPDCVGIMPHCIDSPKPEIEWDTFHGEEWEKEIEKRGAPIPTDKDIQQ